MSFAVADNPFYKNDRTKFYPEIIVISGKGKIKARVGGCEED